MGGGRGGGGGVGGDKVPSAFPIGTQCQFLLLLTGPPLSSIPFYFLLVILGIKLIVIIQIVFA